MGEGLVQTFPRGGAQLRKPGMRRPLDTPGPPTTHGARLPTGQPRRRRPRRRCQIRRRCCCCFVTVCARAGGGGRAAVVEIKISSGGGRVRESPETQGGMVLKGVDAGVRGGLTRIVGRSCGWGMVGVHKTPINGRTKTKTTHKGKSQTGAGKEETTGGGL